MALVLVNELIGVPGLQRRIQKMLYVWNRLIGVVAASGLAAAFTLASEDPEVLTKIDLVEESKREVEAVEAPVQAGDSVLRSDELPDPVVVAETTDPAVTPDELPRRDAVAEAELRTGAGPQFPFNFPGWEQRQLHLPMSVVVPSHFPKDFMAPPAMPFPPHFGLPPHAVDMFSVPPHAERGALPPADPDSMLVKEEVVPDGFGGFKRVRVRTWTHRGARCIDTLEQSVGASEVDQPAPEGPMSDADRNPVDQDEPVVSEPVERSAHPAETRGQVEPSPRGEPGPVEGPDRNPVLNPDRSDASGRNHRSSFAGPQSPVSSWTSAPASAKQMTNIWHSTNGRQTEVRRFERRGPQGQDRVIGVQVVQSGRGFGVAGVRHDSAQESAVHRTPADVAPVNNQ